MLAPLALLLVPALALGQAPAPKINDTIAAIGLRIEAAPTPAVGAVVPIPSPGFAATSPDRLRLAALLATLAGVDEEAMTARVREMIAAGHLLELVEPTTIRVTGITPDSVLKGPDDTPTPLIVGVLASGPYSGRAVYLLPTQLRPPGPRRPTKSRDQIETPWAVPPVPGDTEGATAYAEGAGRRATVYKLYKVARGQATAQGNSKPLGSRAAAVERLRAAAHKALAKQHYLSETALAAIVAEGEEADGTADRRAWAGGAKRADAVNDVLLGQIDAALAPGIEAARRAANKPVLGRPGKVHHYRLPDGLATYIGGNTATGTPGHYEPRGSFRTQVR